MVDATGAIFREIEQWLGRAEWNPKLRIPQVAAMLIEAIEHRCRRGVWQLFEYVIMPTQLHLFGEIGGRGLQETLEEFKGWTGNQAAKILAEEGQRFWQREWFDDWSRSDEEDEKIVRYICDNPVKGGLVQEHTDWPYASRK